jgi:hypothetical protein
MGFAFAGGFFVGNAPGDATAGDRAMVEWSSAELWIVLTNVFELQA